MATKWKNKWKIIAWIFLLVFGLSSTLFSFNMISHYAKGSFFKTEEFESSYLNPFLQRLISLELNDISSEDLKKKIIVSANEIEEHRTRHGSLDEQVESIKSRYEEPVQAAKNTNDKKLEQSTIAERDAKIKDIIENFKSDEHVRKKIVKEKEEIVDIYYNALEKERSTLAMEKLSFGYYFKNVETGKVYTNLNVSSENELTTFIKKAQPLFEESFDATKGRNYLNELSYSSYINHPDYEGTMVNSTSEVMDYQAQDTIRDLYSKVPIPTFEGKVLVLKTAPKNSAVMQDYENYKKDKLIFFTQFFVGIIALLIGIGIYRKTKIKNYLEVGKPYEFYNKIPIDGKVIAFVISLFITYISLHGSFWSFESYRDAWENNYFIQHVINQFIDLLIPGVLVTITFVLGKWLMDTLKQTEDIQAEWENSYTKKFVAIVKNMFINKSIGVQSLMLLGIIFLGGVGAVSIVTPLILIYIPLFIFILVPAVLIFLKRIAYFNKIAKVADNIANGQLQQDIPVKGKSVFAQLAHNINKMKNNVSTSQQQQVKSERLKTELISNVSHDLRTPLTSIITYTDLLKSGNLTEDEQQAYIEIIDRKSQRLKLLIDDLFEASKMATGNIELQKERVDIVQLLKQSLAELDEKINASHLQFRTTIKDEPIYAVVDGRKVWRVFDNLLNNILNYSLESSRVYITAEKQQNNVVVTFKNVSKYELGMDTDELVERFKRGDTSRHTEGSGLGLAIAKSIIDLHGGSLLIDTNGDLFTVTVSLPAA